MEILQQAGGATSHRESNAGRFKRAVQEALFPHKLLKSTSDR